MHRRNVCNLHKIKLIVFSVVGICLDLMLPHLSFGLGHTPRFDIILLVLGIIYFSVQVAIGAMYIYQTYNYVLPLKQYIQHPSSRPSSEHEMQVRSLVHYLRLSIFAMVAQTTTLIGLFVFVARGEFGSTAYAKSIGFLAIGTFVAARITLSYAQMKSIAPPLDSKSACQYWKSHGASVAPVSAPVSATIPAPTSGNEAVLSNEDKEVLIPGSLNATRLPINIRLISELEDLASLIAIIRTGSPAPSQWCRLETKISQNGVQEEKSQCDEVNCSSRASESVWLESSIRRPTCQQTPSSPLNRSSTSSKDSNRSSSRLPSIKEDKVQDIQDVARNSSFL